ncbi:MAG: tetratricopeptide (TPR) repeat protein [Planctomycetota bacterium]|jgi:tetratricopeptide (TPR) repeat protein
MWRCLVFLLLLSTSVSHPGIQEDVESFERDYGKVISYAKRSRWKKAGELLDKVLLDHALAPYVFAKKREILEYLERCAFHSEYPDAKPADVVSGELHSYDSKRGKIKITYSGNYRDFDKSTDFRYHQAKLAGPTTIEISGKSHPVGQTLYARACVGNKIAYSVIFGCNEDASGWFPGRIRVFKNEVWEEVDTRKMSPVKGGKKFKLKLKIGAKSINAYYNGRAYMAAKKKSNLWESWGIDLNKAIEKVTLTGTIEPSWIKGKIDQRRQENLASFRSTFKLSAIAPSWLLKKQEAVARGKSDRRNFPGKMNTVVRNNLSQVWRFERLSEWELGLAEVEKLPSSIPAITKEWYRGVFKSRLGRWPESLIHADAVLAVDPTFFEASALRGNALERLRRRKEARAHWRSLIRSYPGESYSFISLAYLLLDINEIDQAQKILSNAIANGHRNRQIKELEETLFRAKNGPKWGRVFVWKSRHYEVHTDIDKKTAEESAKVLEKAFSAYSAYMGRVKNTQKSRFRVFIFSGEAGYAEYVTRLSGSPSSHTAGLYFPLLKQLLIWNLPNRDDMLKTVQHEGFHQFIDSITEEMPTWLNEGTAEYYETATSGRWSKTPVRPDHLTHLDSVVGDLAKFVRIKHKDFYARAGFNYARGWALVYFLRHSTPANKALLVALHEKLKSGMRQLQAINQVFDQVSMKQIKIEIETFLKELPR